MRKYEKQRGGINNTANLIALTPGFHRAFDNRWFLIAPKIGGSHGSEQGSTNSPQYVSHILSLEAKELWPAYHNTLVQYLHPDARPYLFARFAWSILFLIKGFVTDGDVSRNVKRIQSYAEDGSIVQQEEFLSGSQLSMNYGGGGSKSATPRKRRTGTGSAADSDYEMSVDIPSDDNNIALEDSPSDAGDDWEGRRKQLSSEETAVDSDQPRLLSELKEQLTQAIPPQQEESQREEIA